MNEQEAIKKSKYNLPENNNMIPNWKIYEAEHEAIRMAINALEEIQKYRAIGTPEELENIVCGMTEQELYREGYNKGIEECREAVEKQKAKKVIDNTGTDEFQEIWYQCPSCKGDLTHDRSFFCGYCGQRLSWKDGEKE